MKTTIRIATGQFEFLEIKGTEDDIPHMLELQRRYSEKPVDFRRNRQKLQAFVGGEIYFDPERHEYSNEKGELYLSGSKYAEQFAEKFDRDKIAAAMAKKYGVKAEDILAMWEMKSDISKGLGTALHAAMEMYGRYGALAEKMGGTANHDNPMVVEAVKQFYAQHMEVGDYEVLVVDHATKRAGRIDRLVRIESPEGKNYCNIDDFKTDVNIQKGLPKYQKQLSFYAAILEANGVAVDKIRVHHWDGSKWTTYNLEKEKI